jgi:hypothetical protein
MKAVQLSTIGQRFETSRFGEVVISCLVVVVLLIGVVWSLPDADIRRGLIRVLHPVATATGLEQSWRMYAPEPLRRLDFLEVRVTMTNGVQRDWTNSRGDRVLGVFAWYHWQKVKENVVNDPASRVGVAHWVVRRLTGRSEQPARVQMILRTEDLAPPGAAGPPVRGQEILYDENLVGKR